MKNLIKDLRLEIARFNTFIIENYLLHIEVSDNDTEPLHYFHNVLHKLTTSLADFGGNIEQLDFPLIQNRILHLLKNLVSESILTIFLIDKSNDLENLILNIRSVSAHQIATTIENIQQYGTLFKKNVVEIETEINQFKSDYPDFFDFNGQLKYTPLNVSADEAFEYLIDNTQIPDLRGKFIRAFDDQNYININQLEDIESPPVNNGSSNINENELLKKIISSLFIVFLAYSYAEPFFKMPDQLSNDFTKHIRKLTYLLNQITNFNLQ